jgi:hypothetical protein
MKASFSSIIQSSLVEGISIRGLFSLQWELLVTSDQSPQKAGCGPEITLLKTMNKGMPPWMVFKIFSMGKPEKFR